MNDAMSLGVQEEKERALSITVEFAKRCLLVHREIPIDDVIAQAFWADYCHNLGWLIEDCHPGKSQALGWYLSREPYSSPGIRVGRGGVSERKISRAKTRIDQAVSRVFHGARLKEYVGLMEAGLAQTRENGPA